MKPRLLDLFCGAGGAARGYQLAGFHVTGVDTVDQPRYAGDEFVKADALEYLATYGPAYVAIHASPPCHDHSALSKLVGKDGTGWLLAATRIALDCVGLPYVIENVQGAAMGRDLTLCGEMFGLGVIRHRYFELGGWSMPKPEHIKHRGRVAGWRHGVHHEGPYLQVYGNGGGKGSVADWQRAMGIDWTDDRYELAQAIPPAYTKFIGEQLLTHVRSAVAA